MTGWTAAASAADAAVATLDFAGQISGWFDAVKLAGQSDLGLTASRIDGNDLDLRAVRLGLTGARTVVDRDDRGLGWRLDGAANLRAVRAGHRRPGSTAPDWS